MKLNMFNRSRMMFLFVILGLMLIVGVVMSVSLPSLVSIKSRTVDLVSSLPYALVRLGVRESVRDGNFQTALTLLKTQEKVAGFLGNTSFMRQDVIEHTRYVVSRARIVGQEILFDSWLKYLEKTNPNSFIALSASVSRSSDFDPDVFHGATGRALSLFPMDPEVYRKLLAQPYGNPQIAELTKHSVCTRYKEAAGGRYDSWFFPDKFPHGQGFSAPIIFLDDGDSSKALFASDGVRLSHRQIISFEMSDYQAFGALRVFLPWPNGTTLSLHSIQFQTSKGLVEFQPQELDISSMAGFVLNDHTYLISSEIGDTLVIRKKTGAFPRASRVAVESTITRLPLHTACLDD